MTSDSKELLRPGCARVLGVAATYAGPVAASNVLKRVNERLAAAGDILLTPSDLAHETRLLETAGLLTILRAERGAPLRVECTPRGRQLARGGRRTAAADGGAQGASSKGPIAASIGSVILTSCAVTANNAIDYKPAPLPTVSAEQRPVDGRLSWVPCFSDDDCPGPTPKTRTYTSPLARSQPTPPAAVVPNRASGGDTVIAPAGIPVPDQVVTEPRMVAPVVAVAAPVLEAPARSPTPQLRSTPPANAVAVTEHVDAVSVFFRLGDAAIAPRERDAAVSVAARIAKSVRQGALKVVVVGMTDRTGSADFNARLSQLRADRVKLALSDAGVDLARIITRVDTSGIAPVPTQTNARATPTGPFAPYRRVDVIVTSVRPGAPNSPVADVNQPGEVAAARG